MAKNLYEILEVNARASEEAIEAAYARLSKKFDPEAAENRGRDDVLLKHKAVKEAYATLGNAERRRRYDQTHPAPGVIALAPYSSASRMEPQEGFWTLGKVLVLLAVVSGAAGYYIHLDLQRREAAEQARIEFEREREAGLAEEREEQRQRQDEAHERRQRDIDAARAEAELRRFQVEVGRNERERDRALEAAARRETAEARNAERRLQAQEREASARARAELAELERKQRQREMDDRYSRPRVIVIPDPHDLR